MTNQNIVLPAIALRGTTILPGMIVHFDVSRERSVKAIEAAMLHDQKIFLVTQIDPEVESPDLAGVYHVGTIAYIKQVVKLPQNLLRVLVEGTGRATLVKFEQEFPFIRSEITPVDEEEMQMPEPVMEAMHRSLKELFHRYCMENGKVSNSVSYGNVTNTVTDWKPKTGGFSGTNTNGNIQNCSAAGVVTGSHPTIAPGGFIGYDDGGTTAGCAFDQEKNPALNGVGDSGTSGSNQIAAVDTKSLNSNICGSYNGGHTLSKVDAKEATHLAEGNIEYWLCTKCGCYFSDAGGSTAIAAADVVIPKTAEHTVDSTGWHSDADNHWNTCECGEKLNLSGHSFTWVIDKKATAEEKGSKHEQCTVCGYAKAAVEIPVERIETSYAITEGKGSSYALQSGSSLTVRGNGDFSKFTGIKVDGVQIGADNYEAKSGSTIVTLKSSYLDTLAAGTHSIEILWKDGSASTTFKIQQNEGQKPNNDGKDLNSNQKPADKNPADKKPANQNPQSVPQNNVEQTDSVKNESPKTGDDDNIWVLAACLFLLGSGFVGVTYYRKRKHLY